MDKLTTFLVEDSPLIRDSLIGMLEELTPVEVVATADTEHDAVDWLQSHCAGCRLVIIDIFLKAGSGLPVIETARRLSGAVTLVVLSNYATPAMKSTCMRLGADRVFDKSNQIDEFVTFCSELC